jgi:hypothetical protein
MPRLFKRASYVAMFVLPVMFLAVAAAQAQIATTSEAPEKILIIHDVRLSEDRLFGEITNNSAHEAREISLMVQNIWRWKDGYNPKIEAAVNAVLFKLAKDLEPGETATFSHVISLPKNRVDDGQLITDVSVAGFKLVQPEETPRLSLAQ